MVLFYFDLQSSPLLAVDMASLTIERSCERETLLEQDYEEIVNFATPSITSRHIEERFRAGASIWLARWNGKLAGYGWSLTGRSIEPHYFAIAPSDVHLFDFLVFPEYRGHGINPALVMHILSSCRSEGCIRAYIEAAEWNEPQLKSLRKTGFRCLGKARKVKMIGRSVVVWNLDKCVR